MLAFLAFEGYFRNYERASKDQSVLTELPNNYSDDCVMVLSASIKRTFTGGLLVI